MTVTRKIRKGLGVLIQAWWVKMNAPLMGMAFRGKDFLTRISRLEGALFQEEGTEWETAWKDKVLVKLVRQTQA